MKRWRPMAGRLMVVGWIAAMTLGCLGDGRSGQPGNGSEVPTLRLFAAASLLDVAHEWAASFEEQQAVRVVLNTAGSNVLAQQIVATDGADVFISADRRWVDFLDSHGRSLDGTRRDVLANRLVVVARRDSVHRLNRLQDLATSDFRYLALADPAGVPAGRYAQAHLQTAEVAPGRSVWDAVAERVVPSLDVRAALALSASDPDILAMVYRTDALQSEAVRVLLAVPPHPDITITYCAVVIEDAAGVDVGRRFLDFLATPQAAAVAARHGFDAL